MLEKNLDQIYLDNIIRKPRLTVEQERECGRKLKAKRYAETQIDDSINHHQKTLLATAIEQGNKAREMIIESNLSLVLWVAKRFQNNGLELMDLMQEGTLGLMKAVDRFDVEKGVKFSTYATWWIRQAITRSLSNQSRLIRLPERIVTLKGKIKRIEKDHYAQFRVMPTIEVIANKMNLKPEYVSHIKRSGRAPLSLDMTIDEHVTLKNILPSEELNPELLEREKDKALALANILKSLTQIERKVIAYRYGLMNGEMHSYQALSKKLDIEIKDARKIEKRARYKLKPLIIDMRGDII
jgi:RNA polymerase primary sigma factor